MLDLRADDGGGHALVSALLDAPARAGAVRVTTPAGAVVYAKARARGVSLLIGAPAPPGAAATITYVCHCGGHTGDAHVSASIVLQDVPAPLSAATQRYARGVPSACAATAHHGVRVANALALAAAMAHSARSPTDAADIEPVDGVPVLPPDAYQVLAFIARDLQTAD